MRIPAGAYEATLEFGYVGSPGIDAVQAAGELLHDELDGFGFHVMGIDDQRDEGISWVELANVPPFVVQVGIARHPQIAGRLLAYIYPPLPFVRIWLRRVSTVEIVSRLGEAVRSVLEQSPAYADVRWLSQEEIRALPGLS